MKVLDEFLQDNGFNIDYDENTAPRTEENGGKSENLVQGLDQNGGENKNELPDLGNGLQNFMDQKEGNFFIEDICICDNLCMSYN